MRKKRCQNFYILIIEEGHKDNMPRIIVMMGIKWGLIYAIGRTAKNMAEKGGHTL